MLKRVKRFFRRTLIAWTVFLLVSSSSLDLSHGQDYPAPDTGEAIFSIFVRSTPAGIERIKVIQTPQGWQIISNGQINILRFENRLFQIDYDHEWRPRQLSIDATIRSQLLSLTTTFDDGTATNQIREGYERITNSHSVHPSSIVLSTYFFGAYEALGIRLSGVEIGTEVPIYEAPQGKITAVVREILSQFIETKNRSIKATTYKLTINFTDHPMEVELWTDENNRLLRVSLPSLEVEAVRQDIVLVSTRLTGSSIPGDDNVRVATSGFSLAGTVTTPIDNKKPKDGWPAVLLIPGPRSVDRDENLSGVRLFSDLASALSDTGYLVMRYDQRGVGRSGGRSESAKLEDYADDVRTLSKYLDRRKDVDENRIIVIAHGEGGWIGLQAASREKRISGLALLSVPGILGADLVLEQQRAELDRLRTSAANQAEKIALQIKIHEAVLGLSPWEHVPPNIRKQADTVWFRSFLQFEPAKIMQRTSQPILILHGQLDTEVLPYHADRLVSLAQRYRSNKATVEVSKLPGINHLLIPAVTGSVDEYSQLQDKNVSSRVISVLTDWLSRIPPR